MCAKSIAKRERITELEILRNVETPSDGNLRRLGDRLKVTVVRASSIDTTKNAKENENVPTISERVSALVKSMGLFLSFVFFYEIYLLDDR